ncbi:hypothetical protein KHC33_04175 [Methanospirillum sp. J.3.6.1-F.2.7.3]|uniref:Uncharacterized protein n=1 Tax=Methanospirillum purgamenti TaxID=2834276 RepID=A0A8E7B0I6_9EURY|nr:MULTISPECIES: hypothetical protein [Methanospirillum]MDX8551762.1 hypothetical protein [Methanospirillum hungatei]QVV89719.1 hypothetical protein KHC33_04175 [Methanospirillum sp. J.3.6.1-F.2.7.3]
MSVRDFRLKTTLSLLNEKYKEIPQSEQLDAIFVLNKFTIYNFRNGEGKAMKLKEKPLKGFVGGPTVEKTIYFFMEFLLLALQFFLEKQIH